MTDSMAGAQSRPWLDLRSNQREGLFSDDGPDEFVRLWSGFMTARVTLGVVLLALQTSLFALGYTTDPLLVIACGIYLVATLATRLLGRPQRLGTTLGARWALTVGVDVATFALLQYVQGNAGINYSPLLALPVLMAAVLGSMPLAMATAAGATLLLLLRAGLDGLGGVADASSLVAQSALTGAGYFVIAFLASQLSARLASEEQRSRRSQMVVRVQREVNALVIESLTDGILVVDEQDLVLAANPAACRLLGRDVAATQQSFSLALEPGWQELAQLNRRSLALNTGQNASVVLTLAGIGPQFTQVRTRIAATDDITSERLCVMFVQDQREVEARMRTEKLVSMGRMSSAVAHEIRNPLAAIVQANALLDEGVDDARLKPLIRMVQQNANRLERIVDEVLNIARVSQRGPDAGPASLQLNNVVAQICTDWDAHGRREAPLALRLSAVDAEVAFEAEHLRRVLINLLDNANRYAGSGAESIQVSTSLTPGRQVSLQVWSDGKPMEPSVRRHLFEPFFSSESRSTGLGLYICRELCDGHGALIGFERAERRIGGAMVAGNEFRIRFASASRRQASAKMPL
ncbi:MAG TPA: ATP-binding protein [Burkholderiaceae bacterium]|nr:ATP-binding protein [Burkholderiaceae bacterium]HRA61505.1 ATP-binding protein [Burkholderiaceae bacterium]